MDFEYLIQPPKKFTFEMPEVKRFVEQWCRGKVLNLFAGMVKLDINEVRIDINEEMRADYYMDALEFVNVYQIEDGKFDTVILDPPYNVRKAREKYKDRWVGSLTMIKNALPRIIESDCRVINLGYDSVGMSKKRGFKKIAIALVCHNGDHNDTIIMVEELIQQTLQL